MMTQNEKVVAALREAADWLEAHPELPSLYVYSLGVFSTYDRDVRKDLVLVAKAMGGRVEKEYTDDYLTLRKRFGGVADISYSTEREKVCERVVTGTRIIPPEPEKIIPAQPEREVEIVEWRCKPLMNQPELEDGVDALPAPEPAQLVEAVDDIPF